MVENIEFIDRGKNGAEINIQYKTGETTILVFNNEFPPALKDLYLNCLYSFIHKYPLLDNETFSYLIPMWLPMYGLITPLTIGTFKNDERIRLGKRLKELREEKNIEAKRLATITGIDPANISRVEQGKHSVGIDILSRLANALGYKIDFVKL